MLNDDTKIQIIPRYIQNSNSKTDINNQNVYQNQNKISNTIFKTVKNNQFNQRII